MTKKFLLIQAGNVLDDTSKFFCVLCSEDTERGRRQIDYITADCDKQGWFFAKYSLEVSEFLAKCRVFMREECRVTDFPMTLCHAADYIRARKQSVSVPVDVTAERNRRYLMESIDLNYRIYRNLSILHRK